jgi:hypothetical protein
MIASDSNVFSPTFSFIVLIGDLDAAGLASVLKSADALLELAGGVANAGNHDVVANSR